MKIIVAGSDKTDSLGSEIVKSAQQRVRKHKPKFISPEISALCLEKSNSEQEYLNEMMRLLRYRDGVGTVNMRFARKKGPLGLISRRIRIILWRVLRYQFDAILYRQNLINCMYTSMHEFRMAEYKKEIKALKNRISNLENKARR